jgi:preprotein translocase subunit SecB
MIINKSDFNYLQFGVVEFNYKCIIPTDNQKPANDLLIDFNYEIIKLQDVTNLSNIFEIILNLKLSPEQNSPGYSMNFKTYGVFELSKINEKTKIDQALLYTCLPLVLGSTRGYVGEVTSSGPFGKYMLPSLDVSTIIQANKNTINTLDK